MIFKHCMNITQQKNLIYKTTMYKNTRYFAIKVNKNNNAVFTIIKIGCNVVRPCDFSLQVWLHCK